MFADMFENKIDFNTIISGLEIPVIRELELSKMELDKEKQRIHKKMQQEISNTNNSGKPSGKVTNRGVRSPV